MRGIAFGTAAIVVGATLVALALLAFVIAASGIYNVAASRPHFEITRDFLHFALRRSVVLRSLSAPSPPRLDDPDLIRLGAGHFARGCAFCHGAPGEPRNVAVESMRPSPPELSLTVPNWSDSQLFWIVKHGFKYTGMPAWPAQQRDDEVWALVAFLRQLPRMQPDTYRELATGTDDAKPSPRVLPPIGGDPERSTLISECARCHGDENAPSTSRRVPKLAGQTAAYLVHALDEYAKRSRPSGIMEFVAAQLAPNERRELASYYAGLTNKVQEPRADAAEQIERGRTIANFGVREKGVPPCLACHSGRAAATFPLLSGQHAPYLVRQLKLFHDGVRASTAQGAIMTAVAQRLNETQIEDLAAYFESRDPADDSRGELSPALGAAP